MPALVRLEASGCPASSTPWREGPRVEFRIGINVGDIIIDEGDIYGDGVNIAARVESLASPGEICLADNAYQQIKGKLAFDSVTWVSNTLKTLRSQCASMGCD